MHTRRGRKSGVPVGALLKGMPDMVTNARRFRHRNWIQVAAAIAAAVLPASPASPQGIVIDQVASGTEVENAGLQIGDVLVSWERAATAAKELAWRSPTIERLWRSNGGWEEVPMGRYVSCTAGSIGYRSDRVHG